VVGAAAFGRFLTPCRLGSSGGGTGEGGVDKVAKANKPLRVVVRRTMTESSERCYLNFSTVPLGFYVITIYVTSQICGAGI
jgi:hypothetical protein